MIYRERPASRSTSPIKRRAGDLETPIGVHHDEAAIPTVPDGLERAALDSDRDGAVRASRDPQGGHRPGDETVDRAGVGELEAHAAVRPDAHHGGQGQRRPHGDGAVRAVDGALHVPDENGVGLARHAAGCPDQHEQGHHAPQVASVVHDVLLLSRTDSD